MRRLVRGTAIAVAGIVGTAVVALAAQPATTHGNTVSSAAHASYASGRDRGAAVSAVASANGQANGAAVSAAVNNNGQPNNTGASGTHGAAVSAVAKDKSTTGKAHGKAVSAVARAAHGKPTPPTH
jgi:hypothetical protein